MQRGPASQDIDQSFKKGHKYSFHASNASGPMPPKSIESTCTRFLVGTPAISLGFTVMKVAVSAAVDLHPAAAVYGRQ